MLLSETKDYIFRMLKTELKITGFIPCGKCCLLFANALSKGRTFNQAARKIINMKIRTALPNKNMEHCDMCKLSRENLKQTKITDYFMVVQKIE